MNFYKDKEIRYHHRHFHNEGGHHHHQDSFDDYNNAVNEYKKSFPSKANVIENTPDPAVRKMLVHMEKQGCETCFDRLTVRNPTVISGLRVSAAKTATWGRAE